MLVFDTETRTDATQRLTFGSYRFFVEGRCLEEGLFYADDLPEKDRRNLEQYAATHRAETASGGVRDLKLLTRSQFVDKFYTAVYKGGACWSASTFLLISLRIACDFCNRARSLCWRILSRAMVLSRQDRPGAWRSFQAAHWHQASIASAPSKGLRRGTARTKRT